MRLEEKLRASELNVLINAGTVSTLTWEIERQVIEQMDYFGRMVGYGRLQQIAEALCSIQCYGVVEEVADLKRDRFGFLGWELPPEFERTAAR